jgi:tetratricopeptide (TPR) repeat protein
MLNVNSLEQQWKRYKLKSLMPYGIILSSLSLLVVISVILFSEEDETTTKKTLVTKTLPELNTTQVKTIQQVQIENKKTTSNIKVMNSSQQLKLKPSLSFIHEIERENETRKPYVPPVQKKVTPQPVVVEESIIVDEPLIERIKPTQQIVEANKEKEQVVSQQKNQTLSQNTINEENQSMKQASINITRKTTEDDLESVIERFNKSNNPALSLFIARKYYELGQYKKSYNYALITNEINSDIESCWIIFAKSLVKLNQKEKAIQTLKKYINHSGSSRATALLDRITTGKFE